MVKGRQWGDSIESAMWIWGVVVSFSLLIPSSACALEHPFLETFGSANNPSFSEAQGMAIDQATGDLLVIDRAANTLSRYNPNGTPANFSALGTNVISGFSFGNFHDPGEVQVAVDDSGGATDGNIYVPEPGAGVVDIFGKDGSLLGELTGSSEGAFVEPCGVGVDPSGNVYVGDFSGKIHKYEPSGSPPVNGDNGANFVFATNCTLAAGAGATTGFIFPAHFGGSVVKLDSTTGEERYAVDAGPTTTVTVDPATGRLYTASGSEVKEYNASGSTEATALTSIAPGGGKVTGVAVNETSGEIYVARAGSSQIEVWGAAVLLPEAFTQDASVVGSTVTFHGGVSAAGGPPATCVFQYVEVKATGFEGASSVPCFPTGPYTGSSSTSVSAEISGLPEAAYRFRLVASNENGSKEGETGFFSTFERMPGLPDNRAYEMVSPPKKVGEVIPPEPAGSLGSTCGECMPGENYSALMAMQSALDGESVVYLGQPFSGGLAAGLNEYLGSRTSDGWKMQGLNSPLVGGSYQAFSSDLSRGVLQQTEPTLSPEAPTRGGKGFANLYLPLNGSLRPLITIEPPNRNPSDFEVLFGGVNAGTNSESTFDHLLFEANDTLTEEVPGIAPKAPNIEASQICALPGASCNIYEWTDNQLRLVNVLPDNTTPALDAVIGSGRLLAKTNPQFLAPNVDHAISNDGSRIFWTEKGTGKVYVRIDGVETLEIPSSGSCKESILVEERACFLTASPNGSEVLLSDGQIFEINAQGDAYEATLDLTEGMGGFQGILGAAEDLSHIYFVDTKALTEESKENANKEHAEEGELNLYAWSEGVITFIGALQADDNRFGTQNRYGAWTASRPNRTAQVSSDGSYLAFMSAAPLTGYDNDENFEVFEYSASSEVLICASCNPTGQQPLGPSNLSLIKPGSPGSPSFPQPGNLSHEGGGRLFFESQDALSPNDTNGHIQDVYEWEPNGAGSCKRADGCVYLISSGHSPNDSMFLDSTPSGDDVFFITREQLLPRDKDSLLDLYDARAPHTPGEEVGFAESGISPCEGEGCAGPAASPPVSPGAGSPGFIGPVNPPPKPTCKPGFVKKHGKCVKKKHKNKRAKRSQGGSR
jgi:hypothetical protein